MEEAKVNFVTNVSNNSLPTVCTKEVVVFPKMNASIQIGRQQSIKALEVADKEYNGKVLVVCQRNFDDEVLTQDLVYKIGTVCQIESKRQDNNFIRVIVKGLYRAEIKDFKLNDGYYLSSCLKLDDIMGDAKIEASLIRQIAKRFEQVIAGGTTIPKAVIEQLARGTVAPLLADQFGQSFPLTIEKRQEILEAIEVNERLTLVLEDLEIEQQMNQIDQEISDKVRERVEDSQKDYFLREKLRVIKEELGDVPSQDNDIDGLRKKMETNPYPDHIKAKMKEELDRYEMLPSTSGEASVQRTYLDWLFKVPWYTQTTDQTDLGKIKEVLDEDHYGLKKVKDRIMEYIAVKNMTNSLKAPIICLVGPPGVGKTSLTKSIARALGRKYVKVSLGGVNDEAEIRGHRRTYLGSLPGRIIEGMKRAGVVNPVFLIDELDKMSSDYKGDPASAMLEVLDPEQNTFFSDHYLEEPYDLSKVLFIATANYLENIPQPLIDRLEIIEVPSYTEEEKLHIAKEHLIGKQLKENGLKESQFHLSDDQLIYLIRYYTHESGVRQLERMIASLCRKTVLAILSDKKHSVTINKKLINTWLGKEIYSYGAKEKKNLVGVATGLAYTAYGGDILPIEVTYFEGKGAVIVTGQLGDVMKESATVAVGYVKSHAKEYGIDPAFFEKKDIQIHVPEGAVPKDGPSAGITLTTAIISALTSRPVHSDLAMTGEVTLTGNVLPIGGLKEKSMAAHRSGIAQIIIPKKNLRDMDEIPQSVKDNTTFIPVENMSQVIKAAIVK